MGLHLVPLTQRQAAAAISEWHRHNRPPRGDVIRVGLADDDGQLVAVGCAGRPVARHLDNGLTLEITRVATDGTRNANSRLYGALCRAALALGYRRVITYTQASESGASLRAAGWRVLAQLPPRRGWDAPRRSRDNSDYQSVQRVLWEVTA